MLNKILDMLRRYEMVQPGDTVICAVSGGADSVALLFGMYLLRQNLGIRLEAAHFNHGLRGVESDRDADFVKRLCGQYDIALHMEKGIVITGKKGLEAAARDARYAFFSTLSGKIATAHTADDNAETVLMHLVRGTGLKGLGGITPVRDNLIRPMLTVTREEVLDFLAEYHLDHVTDSTNETDAFLRNRLRRHVLPLLKAENPRLAENLSGMAMSLRLDEEALEKSACCPDMNVSVLRSMEPAVRARALSRFLKQNGVNEPEATHIELAERVVFSDNPSAQAHLPGGIRLYREYQGLKIGTDEQLPESVSLPCPGTATLEYAGVRVFCEPAAQAVNTPDAFTVNPCGTIEIGARQAGDEMRLPGGTKSLKKVFIDRKIPARQRPAVPVARDEKGVLGVYGIGVNLDRAGDQILIRFEKIKESKN